MRCFILTVALLMWGEIVVAAPPKATSLYPAGVPRGQSITVTAAGSFDPWPVEVWIDRPGLELRPTGDKAKFTATATADAEPGIYWIRFANADGASSLRPFVVGTLEEVVEQEPNDSHQKPQTIAKSSVVVNGQLGRGGDADTFQISLQEGQTLVASVAANRTLGSPMDTSLQILSSDGFVLEQNDDCHELDPQIVFTAPKTAPYLVRTFAFPATPTSTIGFAGGGDFVYRLTLTTDAFAEYAYPLAVSQGASSDAELVGWNIPEASRRVPISAGEPGDSVSVFHPAVANTAQIRIEPHAIAVDAEPNDVENAQEIAIPCTVSGRIDPAGDADHFRFTAKKGQKLVVRVDSRSLGFALDPVVRLSDSSGKVLAENDDSRGGRDAELTADIAADGQYLLAVRDLHRDGGFGYVYRMSIAIAQPDFVLTLAADTFTMAAGKPLEIPVAIERQNGFAGEIEVTAADLPAGVTATTVKSSGTGDSAKAVKLVLQTAADAKSGAFRVIGRAAGDKPLARIATAPIPDQTSRTHHLWVVAPKSK